MVLQGISLYPAQWQLLDTLNGSRSAALRRVIREWQVMRPAMMLVQMYQMGMLTVDEAFEKFCEVLESSDVPVPYALQEAAE
jgi:hypothetical protein